ncbi:hypothetical protein ABPG73_021867 [Tetrahymena malaccensis]
MDTIKQLFNRPADAILENFNQKVLESISTSHKDQVYIINSSIFNDSSKDYSIEISKNNIVPQQDNNYLEIILLKQPKQNKIKELEFVQKCLKQLEIITANINNILAKKAIIQQEKKDNIQNDNNMNQQHDSTNNCKSCYSTCFK